MTNSRLAWGQTLAISALLTALLFLLPLAVVQPVEALPDLTAPELIPQIVLHPAPQSGPVPQSGTAAQTAPAAPIPASRTLRVLHNGVVQEMELEEYLVGVVRAEMPASFHSEALKAQAVAARTYTLRQIAGGGRHGDADLCTNPGCCQAWVSEQEMRNRWGASAQAYVDKTAAAVQETAGQVLLYGGEPILSVFHAASPGLTRPSGDVWSQDLPYLQSVSSPEGDSVPDYRGERSFTAEELRGRLQKFGGDLSGTPELWLQNAVRDGAGTVETVQIGGVTVRGNTVRETLGLRSACFTWTVAGDVITFSTVGHGHGVGMSQYGADAMAKAGSDYRQIVTHYYPGAELGSDAEI